MKDIHLFGAIDIGSHGVKLKIVQWQAECITQLEEITHILELGDEVFEFGVISKDTMDELVEILEYFARLLKEYQVEDTMSVATAALRRAANRELVLETIRRKTGLHVQIIEDPVEKFLTYKSMRDRIEDFDRFREEGTVFVELTSSGCDITFYRNNKMIRNDEIGIGSLTLKDMLSQFSKSSSHELEALESYVHTKVDFMSNLLKKRKIKNYMAMGPLIYPLIDVFFEGAEHIRAEEYRALYDRILDEKTFFSEKCLEVGLDWQEALVTFIFFKVFLDIVKVEEISFPKLSLRDGLIAQMIDNKLPKADLYRVFNEDPFSTSYQTAKRFGLHTSHARHVEGSSLRIFSALQNEFALTSEDERVLRHTALLHEIGKSLDLRDYYYASASMIRGMRIFSLSTRQVERVAGLCEILGMMAAGQVDVLRKPQEDLRLGAVLALADALDASKDQSIRLQDVNLEKDTLYLSVRVNDIAPFIQESLNSAETFFENVFGLGIEVEKRA